MAAPECSAAALAASTGFVAVGEPGCEDGFALASDHSCDEIPDSCEALNVFVASPGGWRDLGSHYAMCAEGLVQVGMMTATADQFAAWCQDAPQADRSVIKPGQTGNRVMALQAALIMRGYDIQSDGRYGPRTEGAVRDFQRASGLEVDGLAGPNTQNALGI